MYLVMVFCFLTHFVQEFKFVTVAARWSCLHGGSSVLTLLRPSTAVPVFAKVLKVRVFISLCQVQVTSGNQPINIRFLKPLATCCRAPNTGAFPYSYHQGHCAIYVNLFF